MVDALKSKLHVPGKFLPYLEKHRIYEFLNEVTNALLMEQPNDHIQFMKDKLTELMINKDTPRILFIAPPHFDVSCLALQLASVTGSLCISLSDVLACAVSHGVSESSIIPEDLAKYTKEIIKTNRQNTRGWIIHGLPRIRMEALAMQRAGILPTHTFQLLPSSIEEIVPFCSPRALALSMVEMQNGILQYRRRLLGLIDSYRSTLHEVNIADQTMEQIVKTCSQLTDVLRPHCGAPMLPRVLIVGSIGSGTKVQARLLSKRFNIVHVCFEDVMEKAKLEDSVLGSKIRLYINQNVQITNTILASVLEKRIMKRDCLDHGWVLTGYPKNVDQIKALDLMDTPPNRVIFLEVDPGVCLNRLALRCSNVYTGSRHHMEVNPPTGKSRKQMGVHPKDNPFNIARQLKCYQEALPDMLEYLMGTETIVNGNSPVGTVFERVEAVIIRPPHATPFGGCVKDIVPKQTEAMLNPMIPTVPHKKGNGTEDEENMSKDDNDGELVKLILAKNTSIINNNSNMNNMDVSDFHRDPSPKFDSFIISEHNDVDWSSLDSEKYLDNLTTSKNTEKDPSEIVKMEGQYKLKEQIFTVNQVAAQHNLFTKLAQESSPKRNVTIQDEKPDDYENTSGKVPYSEINEAGTRTEMEQKMGTVVVTYFGAIRQASRVSMCSTLETVKEELSDSDDSGSKKNERKQLIDKAH